MAVPTVYATIESGYTTSVINRRQLEDYLDMMDVDEYPLLQAVGLNSYGETITNTRFEWQMDYLVPNTDTINDAGIGGATTVWTMTNPEYFALHDVCLIESELIRVVNINSAGSTVTFERAFAGTAAVGHATGLTVYRLGPARPEGSAPGWAQQVAMFQPYNHTQIFDTFAEVTGTEEAMDNHAPAALLDYRIDKRMREMYMLMEQALFMGIRFQPGGNTGRSTGGLNQFITDVDAIGGAALVFADFEDALQNCFGRAGSRIPSTIWCNAWVSRKISSFGAGSIRTGRTETTFGNKIETLQTNFGTLSVHLDHLVLPSSLYLLNMDEIMIGPLQGRAWAGYPLTIATTGIDANSERLLGEYGIVVKGEDGTNDGLHVRFTNISLTT